MTQSCLPNFLARNRFCALPGTGAAPSGRKSGLDGNAKADAAVSRLLGPWTALAPSSARWVVQQHNPDVPPSDWSAPPKGQYRSLALKGLGAGRAAFVEFTPASKSMVRPDVQDALLAAVPALRKLAPVSVTLPIPLHDRPAWIPCTSEIVEAVRSIPGLESLAVRGATAASK